MIPDYGQRISIASNMFHEMESNARSEKEYERIILSAKDVIFPAGYLCTFKRTVTSSTGSAIPDLAFISKCLSYWAFIEVELAHHSLHSHVLPQISVFLEAYFDEQNAIYLASKIDVAEPKLAGLLKGEPPKVYVISNRYDAEWASEIKKAGAYFFSIRLFKEPQSGQIAFLHDAIPDYGLATNVVTEVKRNRTIPGFVEVQQPGRLPIANGQDLDIVFRGKISRWTRLDTGDKVWLRINGSAPGLKNTPYLITEEQGTFVLKEKKL